MTTLTKDDIVEYVRREITGMARQFKEIGREDILRENIRVLHRVLCDICPLVVRYFGGFFVIDDEWTIASQIVFYDGEKRCISVKVS